MSDIKTLSTQVLIDRLIAVKERALADLIATEQEFGGAESAASSAREYDDTAAVLDEAIRRLRNCVGCLVWRAESYDAT